MSTSKHAWRADEAAGAAGPAQKVPPCGAAPQGGEQIARRQLAHDKLVGAPQPAQGVGIEVAGGVYKRGQALKMVRANARLSHVFFRA
jgi:hypothetical protein